MKGVDFHYLCPNCGCHTRDCSLSSKAHSPAAEELAAMRIPQEISGEILVCDCGCVFTWFDAERKGPAPERAKERAR